MDRGELTRRLMSTFRQELSEHVQSLGRALLDLERADGAPELTVELVNTLFRTAHACKGAARAVGLQPIEQTCHAMESLLAEVRDGRRAISPPLIDRLLEATDALADAGQRLERGEPLTNSPVERIAVKLEQPVATTAPPPPSRGSPEPAPAPSPPSSPVTSRVAPRVSSEKLDRLLFDVATLSSAVGTQTTRERLAVVVDEVAACRAECQRAAPGSPALARLAERLAALDHSVAQLGSALSAEQRHLAVAAGQVTDLVRQVRLVAFVESCFGLDRLVRDLGASAGKEVRLQVRHGNLQVDRSVVDQLRAPLVQLVRNAVDHGLERPEERLLAGKARQGRITITAALGAGKLEVTVEDDGRGLDWERIRSRAVERGRPDVQDRWLLAQYIFEPGFSTAPRITDLSGRGVGLDLVKTHVETLHGSVEVDPGAAVGTTLRMVVPLTLITLRAVLVRAAGQLLAIPEVSVQRVMQLRAGDLRQMDRRPYAPTPDGPVPVFSLARLLGWPEGAGGDLVRLVVVGAAGAQVAFAVDELVGDREVLVRSLGPRLSRVPGVAGAFPVRSGVVGLILGVPELVRLALADGAAAAPLPEPRRVQERRRILVVDDSVTTRSLEKNILEGAGYQVELARDGAEGWRLLEEHGADLVISDVEMPRMSGVDLTATIRNSQRFHDLPVILVSALESDEHRRQGLAVGASAYLPKSAFDDKALLELVEHFV